MDILSFLLWCDNVLFLLAFYNERFFIWVRKFTLSLEVGFFFEGLLLHFIFLDIPQSTANDKEHAKEERGIELLTSFACIQEEEDPDKWYYQESDSLLEDSVRFFDDNHSEV